MALQPGSNLGPYEIIEAIGAGGMGEVYRAHDTRLDRSVAIKVLPAHMSENEELRGRFEREARTISSLNHPHVCSLFDIGREGDVDFLVMEFIDGETLADRLANGRDRTDTGGLRTDEMLRIGAEIAEALDAAHRAGIVHRDLKPGNIMLTRAGVKLLDFGLAKIMETGAADPVSTLTQMATHAGTPQPITQAGTILGTFQYMAPEQLEGREADARSDLFSFGAILYEMATGKKAFEGQSQASLIAAILERDPAPISQVAPLTPPALENLVKACLAKDPEDRVQTAHDMLLQLRWIIEGGSMAGIPAPVAAHRRRAARLPWIVAGALGVLAAVLAFVLLTRDHPERMRMATSIRLPDDSPAILGGGGHLSISPDGRQVAYAAVSEEGSFNLWIRSIENPAPRSMPGTEGAAYPFWSPDSRHVAYFANGSLRKIPASGGPSVTLCPAPNARGGAWGVSDRIVFAPERGGGIFTLPASGGDPVPVTDVSTGADVDSHRFPCFLPDGEHFVYLSSPNNDVAELRVASLDGSVNEKLADLESSARYANGHLLYARGSTLIAAPFDPKSRKFTGDAITILEPMASSTGWGRADFDVSQNGILVYSSEVSQTGSRLTSYDRDGSTVASVENDFGMDDLALSPDGNRVAFMRADAEGRDIDVWIYDLGRETYSRLSLTGTADDPVWSPDGRRVVYADGSEIYRRLASGAGERELVGKNALDKVPHDWSRDGRWIVYSRVTLDEYENLAAIDLEGEAPEPDSLERWIGKPVTLLATPYREVQAALSPDVKWMAYTSNASGRLEVYVQSFPDLEEKWQISTNGGGMPRWRGDGREIYFMSLDSEIMAVAVTPASDGGLAIGEVRKLFDTNMGNPVGIRTHQYAVRDDGELFVVIERPAAADRGGKHWNLVTNWDLVLGE